MPTVSVIVPNYNHAAYLPARLDSIRHQTFQDFELIVLDDASTDGSLAILQDYSRRMPMQLIVNRRNSGSPFLQWRKGAQLARGKYLWIAESDDFAEPRFLERLVDQLERNPRVGLAFSQSVIVDENGAEHGTWVQHTNWIDREHWLSDYVGSGREECGRYLLFANTIPNASAVVLRTDVFRRQARRMPRMRLCGDWLLWVRILSVSDVAFVAEALNRHREHRNTVRKTLRLGKHFTEYTLVWKYIARAFRDDEVTQRRLREAVAVGWELQKPRLKPDDDWPWFSSLVRQLWAVSPTTLNSIFRSYLSYRLERVELGFGLRRLRNFVASVATRIRGSASRRELRPEARPSIHNDRPRETAEAAAASGQHS